MIDLGSTRARLLAEIEATHSAGKPLSDVTDLASQPRTLMCVSVATGAMIFSGSSRSRSPNGSHRCRGRN